jgi:hypothetical protein
MRTTVSLPLALAACAGNEVISPPASCETLEADLVGSVDQALWPEGVQEALDLYALLPGIWTADNSCGEEATVKFVMPPLENLQIVTSDWPRFPGLACGCTVDPAFPPDPMFDLVLLVNNYEVYVEDFDDPGVNQVNVVTNGAFYVPDQPLVMRTCAQKNIDPLEGSDYSSASYAVRVLPGGVNGVLQLTITLTDDFGGKKVCDLDNFNFESGIDD